VNGKRCGSRVERTKGEKMKETRILVLLLAVVFSGFGQTKLPVPIVAPSDNVFDQFIDISISPIPNSIIRYTLLGEEPTRQVGWTYKNGYKIRINGNGMLKVKAFVDSAKTPKDQKVIDSDVLSRRYYKKTMKPIIIRASSDQNRSAVRIIDYDYPAMIFYTRDGTTPTVQSTRFNPTDTIWLSVTTTIKAIGVKDKYMPSDVSEMRISVP
jgi:hypothetical protein